MTPFVLALMWTDLSIAADERRDLSSLVQPGAGAVSIRAESGDKSFSLIQPGDYVMLQYTPAEVVANMILGSISFQYFINRIQ